MNEYAWIPVAAIIVNALVRISKTELVASWFPNATLPKYRAWAALLGGIASGVIAKLSGGATWVEAIGGGFAAGFGAISLHELGIESIRNGREVGEPKRDRPRTLPPGPDDPPLPPLPLPPPPGVPVDVDIR